MIVLLLSCGTAEFALPNQEQTDTNGLQQEDNGSDSGEGTDVDPTRDPDLESPGDLLVEVSFISPVSTFSFFYAYCVDQELEVCPEWVSAGTMNQEERSSFPFQAQSGNFGFDGLMGEDDAELIAQGEDCYLTQEVTLWMDGTDVTSLMSYYIYEDDCRAGLSLSEASALSTGD